MDAVIHVISRPRSLSMGVPFRLALAKARDMKPHKRLRRPVIPCFDILILKFTFHQLLVPRNDLSVTRLQAVVATFLVHRSHWSTVLVWVVIVGSWVVMELNGVRAGVVGGGHHS